MRYINVYATAYKDKEPFHFFSKTYDLLGFDNDERYDILIDELEEVFEDDTPEWVPDDRVKGFWEFFDQRIDDILGGQSTTYHSGFVDKQTHKNIDLLVQFTVGNKWIAE